MKVKVRITNNLSLDERKKEVLKIVNTRNTQHLDIQINNPSKIFKNKKKYTRKLKHRDRFPY